MLGTLTKVKKEDFLELSMAETERCSIDGVVASVIHKEGKDGVEHFLMIDGGGEDLILLKNQ